MQLELKEIEKIVLDEKTLEATIYPKPFKIRLQGKVPEELKKEYTNATSGFYGFILVRRKDGLWFEYDAKEKKFLTEGEPAEEYQMKSEVLSYIVPEDLWIADDFDGVKFTVIKEEKK